MKNPRGKKLEDEVETWFYVAVCNQVYGACMGVSI